MTLAFLSGSPMDWGIIMVVALIVFGPKKMPEIGRQLGQAMREFRKIADEFSGAAHSVRDEVESVYKPASTPRPALESPPATETIVKHRPLDQDDDLMAPVVPPVAKVDVAVEDPVKAPLEAVSSASLRDAERKGH